VFFKNYVERHWEARPSLAHLHVISDEDRAAVKSNIVEAVVTAGDLVRCVA
jgi:hypothetical protein